MLNESEDGKVGLRNLTKSERAQEMMKVVLTEMMALEVPNWETAMKQLGYEPNLLHIEVPNMIRTLVGNKLHALYESQEVTIPLFFKPQSTR